LAEPPTPDKVKELASSSRIFRREIEVEIEGVKFKMRRMTLKEELDWYAFRDETLKSEGDTTEKLVKVWENLLQRCIVEPKLNCYTEELPGPVIAYLIDIISELHYWGVDFRGLRRASS